MANPILHIAYNPKTQITIYSLLSTLYSLLFLIGCATVETIPKSLPLSRPPSISGTYHRVERGQTLWRISKLYDIDIDEILNINNLNDSTRISAGQILFIPNRSTKIYSDRIRKDSGYDFIWPVRGKVVSGYGDKTANLVNKGITMRISSNSDIMASNSGIVVFVNEMLRGYGKTIIISHNNGIMTVYSLLSEILVKPGEYINKAAIIAKGENGIMHFEIRKGHIPQNPYYFLPN